MNILLLFISYVFLMFLYCKQIDYLSGKSALDACTNFPNSTFEDDLFCCSREDSCAMEAFAPLDMGSNLVGVNNESGIAIRCDGEEACTSGETKYYMRALAGGDIYATSDQAAYKRIISTDMTSNVICTGRRGCYETKITTADSVIGTGEEALAGAVINGVNSVYCYAFLGCDDANISNAYENVYCAGC